jgi:hypothetical protein
MGVASHIYSAIFACSHNNNWEFTYYSSTLGHGSCSANQPAKHCKVNIDTTPQCMHTRFPVPHEGPRQTMGTHTARHNPAMHAHKVQAHMKGQGKLWVHKVQVHMKGQGKLWVHKVQAHMKGQGKLDTARESCFEVVNKGGHTPLVTSGCLSWTQAYTEAM